jgi:hypothetical protein
MQIFDASGVPRAEGPVERRYAARELLSCTDMPTTDVDPSVQEADLRSARAKESLLARVEQLKDRFTEAKHRFNPQEQIVRHPIPAVGLAFALGVIIGLRGRRSADDTRSSLTGAALAGLATVALRVVREAAMAQLGRAAHDWWAAREEAEGDNPRTVDVDPRLEH